MAERNGPNVYSIAAHRGFADALVAGLVPRYAQDDLGLARLTLLLPSARAVRTVTEAFVRHFGAAEQGGMLMPRMAAVGDLDLDEALGALLDPLGAVDIPPAVEPTQRWLTLAELVGRAMAALGRAPRPSADGRLRLAREIGQTMDRLLVEGVAPDDLWTEPVMQALAEVASHWSENTKLFYTVQTMWLAELKALGMVDAATRRNMLFARAARQWRHAPPPTPIVAAGVTSAAPELARMLRVISELPGGAVILPDLDLTLHDAVWDELGRAGNAPDPSAGAFARDDAVTHPQYHLKLLLNRMGVARDEVRPWHRRGIGAAEPERSHAISSLFLPPQASTGWVDLPPEKRRLAGVRIMESANPEEEAQAISLLVRRTLAEAGKRVAVVTPDRGLAARVASHLRRWNIEADDSAGRPLSQTAAGRLLLLLAETLADDASPVALFALLEHPLAGEPFGRAEWLEYARILELELRGPRPASGLAPIRQRAGGLARRASGIAEWWQSVEAILGPLLEFREGECSLGAHVDALAQAAEALCGQQIWAREDGRALSAFVDDLRLHGDDAGLALVAGDLPTVLREAMDLIAVRPPYGGHPRVSIYGLLESRMARADLVICGGLNEGAWPPRSAPDPLLAPPVMRALGVPGADFRIGLSAHDLAGALGAPEVVLSRAARDEGGPAIPSRFLLRVKALLGDRLLESHRETDAVQLARTLDDAPDDPPVYPRPAPRPDAAQRGVDIAVTALDRLLGDPYQFYAREILGLRSLDQLDAEPSAAWQGTAAHAILERWHQARSSDPAAPLAPVAEDVLEEMNMHPLMRGLWRPRLMAALEWVEREVGEGTERTVVAIERKGEMTVDGVRIHGRADRIDRLSDGTLAIVDYKTGKPPGWKMVEQGFALQLGLIGMMARAGGIAELEGEPSAFEYWSLAKNRDGEFGYVETPLLVGRKTKGIEPERFLPLTGAKLREAIGDYIRGDAPFTARKNPDYPGYADYDQLMRLDEWQARVDDDPAGDGV
ncbi:double-strand break repair protein AddB [Pelagerythrobacter marensis]|uniref:Helicase n=1 Tax=Pelagerythrobacter marensis TaxID=543877 RepID=A0A0G3X955_9SPHN|nr:double-strand break repair protein AddB [Pelagerythrobacter marensis]AKM07151.1 Helicase [Pelagerythrobacter marensis]